MLDKFKDLTPGNKAFFILVIILGIALTIGGGILSAGAFEVTKDGQTVTNKAKLGFGIAALISAAFCFWGSYSIYNDKKRQKKCNTAIWTTMSILAPSNWNEDVSNVTSVCAAQIYAQYSDSDAYAFILRKYDDSDYGYMSIPDQGYKVSQSSDDTYQIYYKKDAKVVTGSTTTTPGSSDCSIEWNTTCTNGVQTSKTVTSAKGSGKTCTQVYPGINTISGGYSRNCKSLGTFTVSSPSSTSITLSSPTSSRFMNDDDDVTITVQSTSININQKWRNLRDGEVLTWTSTPLSSGAYTLQIASSGADNFTVNFAVSTSSGQSGPTCTPGPGTSCGAACPPPPYTYCPSSTISKVFTQNNCSPSANLLTKLNIPSTDSRVVNCSTATSTADLTDCTGKSFPTVVCANSTTIVGYCP